MTLTGGTTTMSMPAIMLAMMLAPAAEGAPKGEIRTSCTCTCVAYDGKGTRHEGGKFEFDTSGSDCTVGIRVKCQVGELEGAYSSCSGSTRGGLQSTPRGPSGVGQDGTLQR